MFRHAPTLGQLLANALPIAMPAWLVLGGLTLVRALDWHLALAGAAIVYIALVLQLRRQLRDLSQVAAVAEAMAVGESPHHPHFVGGRIAADIDAALQRIERAHAERLETAQSRLAEARSVFDSLPDPLLLLDARRRVTFSNNAMRELLGAVSIGADLAGSLRDPRITEAVDAVLRGEPGRTVPFRTVDPERQFEVRVEPLRGQMPGGAACVVAMVDLTALERMERMRSDFVANASHELRTPLTSLIGFIETLRGPARDDAKAREQFLGLMQQQAQRMARLVQDLLSLSTIEMSEHMPPSSRIDIIPVLQSVAATLQVQARDKGMTVVVTADQAVPRVPADPDQLTQVFQNLIDNAIKYGTAHSTITVSVRQTVAPAAAAASLPGGGDKPGSEKAGDADEIEIPPTVLAVAVHNLGPIIGKEHLPRLTERFYRVDAARSRAVGGTGLGLAIAKHVVNRHRGAMVFESEPGQGTTVTVYLPLDRPPDRDRRGTGPTASG